MGDQGGADPALVYPVLVLAERSVARVCPGQTVAMVGVCPARHDLGSLLEHYPLAGALGNHIDLQIGRLHRFQLVRVLVLVLDALAPAHALGATSVVGEEKDQGVVEHLSFLQCPDDPSEPLVEPVDHRGVSLHQADLPFLVRGVLPGDPVPRGQFPFLVDQAHFQLALVACFSHHFPALVVTALVLGHVLGKRVHRPVGRCVGDV